VSRRGLEAPAVSAWLIPSAKDRKRAKAEGLEVPRLRFHDYRHTFASMLIAQGQDVSVCVAAARTRFA
jgi:integrase